MTLTHLVHSHETMLVIAIMGLAGLAAGVVALYAVLKIHDLHYEERE
jgi:hypothetical protein